MGLFFGTDGLRGRVDSVLNAEVAFKCGNALARFFYQDLSSGANQKCKILLGTDTRGSADYLATAFSLGAISAGANVTFVGVCPTAGVGYLTEEFGFNFGVVISASHNPAEFNGIKIFNSNGEKLSEADISKLEKNMLIAKTLNCSKLGKFVFNANLISNYEAFLIKSAECELENSKDFSGLKIVLDCSNGASYKIAPKLFNLLGAKTITTYASPNGKNINKNCGSLNIEVLKQNVLKHKAHIGFAFDGDSDRVIAVAENGDIVDGDQIIYILAKFYQEKGLLKGGAVACTNLTNLKIEEELKKYNIKMFRTDVGDKFINETLSKNELVLGGEQVGHIFLKDKLKTGDGILVALILASIVKTKNIKLSSLICKGLYAQKSLNIKVKNKTKILENESLKNEISLAKTQLNGGRIFVRASGTEPVIRIMAEAKTFENFKENNKISTQNSAEKLAENLNFVAEKLEKLIKKIDSRSGLCVE